MILIYKYQIPFNHIIKYIEKYFITFFVHFRNVHLALFVMSNFILYVIIYLDFHIIFYLVFL